MSRADSDGMYYNLEHLLMDFEDSLKPVKNEDTDEMDALFILRELCESTIEQINSTWNMDMVEDDGLSEQVLVPKL